MDKFSEYIAKNRLLVLVRESRLSQREFALKAEVSPSVISEALSGHHILSSSNANKIAAMYNVSVDWLTGGICNRNGETVDLVGDIACRLCDSDPLIIQQINDMLNNPNKDEDRHNEIRQLQSQLSMIQEKLNAIIGSTKG